MTESHSARLYHLGAGPVSRSTLAEANAQRPRTRCSSGLLSHMVGQAQGATRRAAKEAVRLINSSPPLPAVADRRMGAFLASGCGAKAHVVYDPDADSRLYLAVTPARVNDITAAQAMPIEAGATYVFDLGLLRLCLVGAARRRPAAGSSRGSRRNTRRRVHARTAPWQAGGGAHPVRPHRPSAAASSQRADATRSRSRARGAGRIDTGKLLRILIQRSRRRAEGSPTCTSGAGRSSCSSAGSSRR